MELHNPYDPPQSPIKKPRTILDRAILLFCLLNFCTSLILAGALYLLEAGNFYVENNKFTTPDRLQGLAILVPEFCYLFYGGLIFNALLMCLAIFCMVKSRRT